MHIEKNRKDVLEFKKNNRGNKFYSYLKSSNYFYLSNKYKRILRKHKFIKNLLYKGSEEKEIKDWLINFYKIARSTAYRDIMRAKRFFNIAQTYGKQEYSKDTRNFNKNERFYRLNSYLKNPNHFYITNTDKTKLQRYEFIINSLYNGVKESKIKDWLINFYKIGRSTAYRDMQEGKEFFNYKNTTAKEKNISEFNFIFRELNIKKEMSLSYLKNKYPEVRGNENFYLPVKLGQKNLDTVDYSNLLIESNLNYHFIKFLTKAAKNREIDWFVDYKNCSITLAQILNNVSGFTPIKLKFNSVKRGEILTGVDCVYLISEGAFTKIGSAKKDPIRRLKDLQVANPRPLFLRGVIPYHNYERKVQKEVQKNGFNNLHGEWYNGTPEQIIHCLKSKEFHLEETSIKA